LVVVTYSQPQALMNFLLSLEKFADVPLTLTVINNNSQNGQLTHITKKWRWNNGSTRQLLVNYSYVNQGNVGYAKACNQGAVLGSAPYLLLLNDDVMFTAGCLSKLTAHFERPDYEHVGILGPRQVASTGKLTHAGIVREAGRDRHRFWLAPDMGQANDELDVPTVAGSVYAIRRETWAELTACPVYQQVSDGAVGAFLPTPHYYEETWCSYHARDHGWSVRYQGDVAFIHEWHRSSPVGGDAETKHFSVSEQMFRDACTAHDIDLEF
jgi:GT2 family glycosyltransferase